jgi:hypothetical protein
VVEVAVATEVVAVMLVPLVILVLVVTLVLVPMLRLLPQKVLLPLLQNQHRHLVGFHGSVVPLVAVDLLLKKNVKKRKPAEQFDYIIKRVGSQSSVLRS